MRHLIDFGDLSRQEWDELYARAGKIMDDPRSYIDACRGRVMASLFYEPSTRTNFSFQAAMLRVGWKMYSSRSAWQPLKALRSLSMVK